YHHFISVDEMMKSFRGVDNRNLSGGYVYYDAQTDDMRLVIRILSDAENSGATILNYAKVVKPVLKDEVIQSVLIHDQLLNREFEIPCKILINATGASTDYLRDQLHQSKLIRPLRGSHLVFSKDRLPITKALGFSHPDDRRSVFVLPWNPPLLEKNNNLNYGVTVVGTTDLDHDQPTDLLPRISNEERRYLLKAANSLFPEAKLTESDIVSTWSGIRPVVSSGAKDPSKESRDMFIHFENGLLTVTGGKLTTFRNEAIHALTKLSALFPALKNLKPKPFQLVSVENLQTNQINTDEKNFISAAYGLAANKLSQLIRPQEPLHFEGTSILRAAARFALQNEWVIHLDDLMIRRLRLGLLLPNGAKSILAEIKQFCIEAGWSEKYYSEEEERYLQMIQECYS
ncbi:MAG: FAD-dependent oxidoreductase, partial [Leptonema sp. (in: Bacteria)]|nr:FAD-dependent oxidoreductase [Leptonema sp. (in: bacteria)]